MGVKEGEGGGEAHKGALEAPPHVGSWASGSAGCGCLGQRGRGDTDDGALEPRRQPQARTCMRPGEPNP